MVLKPSRILVFIPMYNCARQVARVLRQLSDVRVSGWVDGVLCVDNQSSDDTLSAAAAGLAGLSGIVDRTLLRNDDNYGLGGSHKVAIGYAQKHGYDFLIVLHGDDQGAIADILPELESGRYLQQDFLMGARFMKGARLSGYSFIRTMANKVFNTLFSVVSRRRLCDLGSGLNMFRLASFSDNFHKRFADDLTFNYYLILFVAASDLRLRFFPLTWREDDQVSNAKLSRMGFQILGLLARRCLSRRNFESGEHRAYARENYPSSLVGSWSYKEADGPSASGS
ncbi:glycosyltransferase family 2 protein [Asaia sp. VD9]|uniref:glycosyltransferase family 2 protein n=1 Tax=Asaia sp. VD9 TaxID=3081235 RepID=UPI003015F508